MTLPPEQLDLFEDPRPDDAVECEKCGGAGWVWNFELDHYQPDPHDPRIDDTKYTCDRCRGEGWTSESRDESELFTS